MILGPDGRPIDGQQAAAALVAPNGEPITATPAPPPEHVVLDEHDLRAFLTRLGVQASRMSEHNPNLALFNEAASWIITMARQIATMQEQAETLHRSIDALKAANAELDSQIPCHIGYLDAQDIP